MLAQTFERNLACGRALCSPGQGTADLNEHKGRSIQRLSLAGRGKEKIRTWRMKAIPRIIGCNPDVGIKRQHG